MLEDIFRLAIGLHHMLDLHMHRPVPSPIAKGSQPLMTPVSYMLNVCRTLFTVQLQHQLAHTSPNAITMCLKL